MKFDVAMSYLLRNVQVTRGSWDANEFLYVVPADRYDVKTEAGKEIADEEGKVSYMAYVAKRTKFGPVTIWTPSNEDIFASDWMTY